MKINGCKDNYKMMIMKMMIMKMMRKVLDDHEESDDGDNCDEV